MAMAASSTAVPISSSSALIESKVLRQQAASPQCISLPTLPPPQCRTRESGKTTAYCRKIARNVMAMATGEAPVMTATKAPPEEDSTELPEVVKTVQQAWDKVEDKYAVTSLAVALIVALWGSTGLISAIDRLPLIPGGLELVGIGYTGWFAYRNLVFKPDRDALIEKVKETYSKITGTS